MFNVECLMLTALNVLQTSTNFEVCSLLLCQIYYASIMRPRDLDIWPSDVTGRACAFTLFVSRHGLQASTDGAATILV